MCRHQRQLGWFLSGGFSVVSASKVLETGCSFQMGGSSVSREGDRRRHCTWLGLIPCKLELALRGLSVQTLIHRADE